MAYTKGGSGRSSDNGGARGAAPGGKSFNKPKREGGKPDYRQPGKQERGDGVAYENARPTGRGAKQGGFQGAPKREGRPQNSFERRGQEPLSREGGFERGGQKKQYGDRPSKGYGGKREETPAREYGFKRDSDRPKRGYADKPDAGYGGKREERPAREYGFKRDSDRPKRGYADKPDAGYGGKRDWDGKPKKGYAAPRADAPAHERETNGAGPQKGYGHADAAPSQPAPVRMEQQEQTLPYFLMGRNAVREAVKNDRSIDRILVVPEQDGSLREILSLARDKGVVVRVTDRKKLDEMCMPFGHNNKPGNHQGILALVPDIEYVDIQDILNLATQREEQPFLLLLDEINDPHNLGSILRSAACAGVHGVVIKKRRSASVTAAVAKISAGAVEHVKVAKVANLTNAMDTLKKAGVWIAGADQQGQPMSQASLSGPLAIVIGNEGDGLSRLVKERCDFLVGVPMRGRMDSLNASVAAAVLMFEKVRQEG